MPASVALLILVVGLVAYYVKSIKSQDESEME